MADRSGFSSVAEIARGMGLQHRLHQRDTKDLSTIVDAGGHLILIRRGLKRPVWSKWEKRKPSMDVVAAHDGRIGLIPSSIGATALDVDYRRSQYPTATVGQLLDSATWRRASVLR